MGQTVKTVILSTALILAASLDHRSLSLRPHFSPGLWRIFAHNPPTLFSRPFPVFLHTSRPHSSPGLSRLLAHKPPTFLQAFGAFMHTISTHILFQAFYVLSPTSGQHVFISFWHTSCTHSSSGLSRFHFCEEFSLPFFLATEVHTNRPHFSSGLPCCFYRSAARFQVSFFFVAPELPTLFPTSLTFSFSFLVFGR